MISIYIPPRDQISFMSKKLTEELGAAQNIKSRVNRQSVISAITSVQHKLKLYNRVPQNGLVVFCGEILTDDGKEKKVNIDFEPFKPINHSLYLCDSKFHLESLKELLEDDTKYGFIIMDGHGALFGTVQGNNKETIAKFEVDLPKKHGRGGQSAPRFGRIRMEKRNHYVQKVAEASVQHFITNDKVNVHGLVLAGSADFKTELSQSDVFDQRLQSKILKIVDISYGGENGFNQAIELASEFLKSLKYVQEKKLIEQFFQEIAKDSGLYCFGVEETIRALESGAIETLLVWEKFEFLRCTFKLPDNSKKILFLKQNYEMEKTQVSDYILFNHIYNYSSTRIFINYLIKRNLMKNICKNNFVLIT